MATWRGAGARSVRWRSSRQSHPPGDRRRPEERLVQPAAIAVVSAELRVWHSDARERPPRSPTCSAAQRSCAARTKAYARSCEPRRHAAAAGTPQREDLTRRRFRHDPLPPRSPEVAAWTCRASSGSLLPLHPHHPPLPPSLPPVQAPGNLQAAAMLSFEIPRRQRRRRRSGVRVQGQCPLLSLMICPPQ